MDDTWFSRDLPVLDAIVEQLDGGGGFAFPTLRDVASATGLEIEDVSRAAQSLDRTFIDLHKMLTGGDPGPWFVTNVSAQARLAVGQWPSAESVVDRLAAGLDAAAEAEGDDDKRRKLREVASSLGGSLREIAVDVTAAVIAKHSGT